MIQGNGVAPRPADAWCQVARFATALALATPYMAVGPFFAAPPLWVAALLGGGKR